MIKLYIKEDIVFDVPQIHILAIIKTEITIIIYFLHPFENNQLLPICILTCSLTGL